MAGQSVTRVTVTRVTDYFAFYKKVRTLILVIILVL